MEVSASGLAIELHNAIYHAVTGSTRQAIDAIDATDLCNVSDIWSALSCVCAMSYIRTACVRPCTILSTLPSIGDYDHGPVESLIGRDVRVGLFVSVCEHE